MISFEWSEVIWFPESHPNPCRIEAILIQSNEKCVLALELSEYYYLIRIVNSKPQPKAIWQFHSNIAPPNMLHPISFILFYNKSAYNEIRSFPLLLTNVNTIFSISAFSKGAVCIYETAWGPYKHGFSIISGFGKAISCRLHQREVWRPATTKAKYVSDLNIGIR